MLKRYLCGVCFLGLAFFIPGCGQRKQAAAPAVTMPASRQAIQTTTPPPAPAAAAQPGAKTPPTISKTPVTATVPAKTTPPAAPAAAQPPANAARQANAADSAARPPRNGRRPAAFELMRLFNGIGRLEKDGSTPLTPIQAKAVLDLIDPLRDQPTLSAEDAENITSQLKAILTDGQIAAIEQAGPGGRGGGPGWQRGASPPRGADDGARQPGPPRGERPAPGAGGPGGMNRPNMANLNPFYTKNDSPFAARMAERQQEVFSALKDKASQQ